MDDTKPERRDKSRNRSPTEGGGEQEQSWARSVRIGERSPEDQKYEGILRRDWKLDSEREVEISK